MPSVAPENSSLDVSNLLNVLLAAHLLLSSDLVIEAASDAYFAATHLQSADLVGLPLPSSLFVNLALAYPSLLASLQQVLATGQPHVVTS